ncbi:cytochrome P450 [Iningainema tapete]|uniref:Cytochrome P450 n=1 Tax=Iningainema tapete BLCC-T55 TaxID=2748662 RepID=A0A8J6XA09_9CYAN|nr:cytochrome P450 [Iningainema tapete]MBD2770795.1 cytochrome P450 [Iningainema tapete BLCC-T55]
METTKILKAHDRQLQVSPEIAKVGYDSPKGKRLRLRLYYMDAFIILRAWTDFLKVRKQHIGNKYYAVDQAIMHTDHADVKKLMHVEPQLRGNDLGIIRILAPSYLLNNPLTLGMNGNEHTGSRAVILQALPQHNEKTDILGQLIDQALVKAAGQGKLHVGDDIPGIMVWVLHQLIFQISLSDEEIKASRAYIKGLALASLPDLISKILLAIKTRPNIQHRKRLIEKYKQSPEWAAYFETGAQYQLNPDQIANSLFDTIHIAGTAGTSALLGSVIGVLCLNDALRNDVVAEINAAWNGSETPNGSLLEQLQLLDKVILETARLYPPVRFVSQLATVPGEVTIGNQKCPILKGTRLLGSIFTANRDANRYENPDNFDINRDFSDILSWNGKDHERACPGTSLSVGIIKIFCLYLFKKYQWSSITEVKWDFEKVTAVTPNNLVLQGFTQQK